MPAEPTADSPKADAPASSPSSLPRGHLVMMKAVPPEGAKPGDNMSITGPDGVLRSVILPPEAKEGEEICVPECMAFPMFSVSVPEGADVGQPLQFTGTDGKVRTVVVPEGFNKETRECTCVDRQAPPLLQVVVSEGLKEGDMQDFIGPDGRPRKATVPPGIVPGGCFLVPDIMSLPIVEATVPEGTGPGDQVELPGGPGGTNVSVTVPEGAKVGERYFVKFLEMLCQPGMKEGDMVTYQSMSTDMMETPVPPNVGEGQPFLVVEVVEAKWN